MVSVINNNASVTAPSFSEIGLEESVLKKCVVSSGLVIFASLEESFNEGAMASAIKYVLENDTFIKGTLVYVGEPDFTFHEIQSTHSIFMSRSPVVADANFTESNKDMMRRSADLVAFKSADTDSMLNLALTGCCVFGQVAANSVVDVVESIKKEYPTEKQYSKMWDFIEATGMILCQRIVEDKDGQPVSVWEYLKLDRGIKAQLFEILDSAEGTEGVVKAIKGIVSNDDFDSQGFQIQADNLLNTGVISENGHRALTEADM